MCPQFLTPPENTDVFPLSPYHCIMLWSMRVDAPRLTHTHLLTEGHAQTNGLSTSHKPMKRVLLYFTFLVELSVFLPIYLIIFLWWKKNLGKQTKDSKTPLFSFWLTTTHWNKEQWLELKPNIQNNRQGHLKNSLLN